MKKILVLGSGPNAEIPEVDAVYCANAAIGLYKDEIRNIPKKVAVVSSGELNPRMRTSGNSRQVEYVKKFDIIRDSPCDLLVAIHTDAYPEGIDSLRIAGYKSVIKEMSFAECRKMQSDLSGINEPIVTFQHFLARPNPRGFASVLMAWYRYNILLRSDNDAVVSPFYRNSTGIISLMYAIYENGSKAEYYVSGISLKRRDSYHGGQSSVCKDQENWRLVPHVLADKKIVSSLAGKYRLNFGEGADL